MILVRRKDNQTINLAAASGTTPHTTGLIVEIAGEYWLVEGYSLDQLIEDTKGRFGTIVIHREFRGWPS